MKRANKQHINTKETCKVFFHYKVIPQELAEYKSKALLKIFSEALRMNKENVIG